MEQAVSALEGFTRSILSSYKDDLSKASYMRFECKTNCGLFIVYFHYTKPISKEEYEAGILEPFLLADH